MGNTFARQTYRAVVDESERAEIFGLIYRALAMGCSLGQASQMAAVRCYLQNGNRIPRGMTAANIERKFSEHHNAPDNNRVKDSVLAAIKDAADADPKVMEGWLEDLEEFKRMEAKLCQRLPAIYSSRR